MSQSLPTILVTGGSGQVGFELQRQLCLLGTVLAPSRQELDLTNDIAVGVYLDRHDPDLIVNAAAYTAVDQAETEHSLAERLNSELPSRLAAWCAQRQRRLVHYSSDYVYSGEGEAPWRETSDTEPLSVYGRTKRDGDRALLDSGGRHLILRTSWVYGARGRNFMTTMLRLGRERDTLKVVDDQVGAPTPARLIAQVTTRALERDLPSGIYHLATRGETSWREFAREIFRQAQRQAEALTIAPGGVRAISTSEYPTPAQRPLNSRLALCKLESALGIRLPTWQEQLALTLTEHLAHRR
ncbi:dTDP-4-dehydrorhamnose reductase [Halomonas sp. THAF5a]|uniref:dTDP-4-dehydrorhamnose reductase n=1 Tax=Halomonas sp. THAF5a TaxID=2587844 RepID=UPI001268D90F|nr:dTDP-4-dehydrorhamnose reductase [Halomonas sp. THAF5a]QFU01733.1 dTDP-4-dehydrorhamnose reductase [Halomonas sp. THAF5a]